MMNCNDNISQLQIVIPKETLSDIRKMMNVNIFKGKI